MNANASSLLPGTEEKLLEYADRVLAGENPHAVLGGLPPIWRDAVAKRLDEALPDPEAMRTMPMGDFTALLVKRLVRPANGWTAGEDLFAYGANVADGDRYDAHGIAKGPIPMQIGTLVRILDMGLDPDRTFHTAPYNALPGAWAGLGAAGGAYRDGMFVLVAKRDTMLVDPADPLRPRVCSVLVNEAGYPLMPCLAARYPHIRWVRGDCQKGFFQDMANAVPES